MFIAPRRILATLLVSVSVGVAMAGCGQAGDALTDGVAADVPTFGGPYAIEFSNVYAVTKSDFVRKVLADEQITDAEYAEMEAKFTACLEGEGIVFEGFEPDGSYETSAAPNGGDTKAIVDECGMTSGATEIGMLHDIMAVNPDNQDLPTLVAKCLVESGVVPGDYSRDAYLADVEGRFADLNALPTDLRDAFVSCSSDPLGLHGE